MLKESGEMGEFYDFVGHSFFGSTACCRPLSQPRIEPRDPARPLLKTMAVVGRTFLYDVSEWVGKWSYVHPFGKILSRSD